MTATAVHHRGRQGMRVIAAAVLGLGLAGWLGGCSTGASDEGAPDAGLTAGPLAGAGTGVDAGTGGPSAADATAPPGSPAGTPERNSSSGRPATPTPVGEVLSTVPAPLPSLGALASAAGPSSPTPSPSGAQLHAPLPSTASLQGGLVEGFPVQIIPVPPGGDVVSSSVSSHGRRLQVGLQASSPASPASVRSTYTQLLTEQGFRGQAGDSSSSAGSPTGPVELRFTRGDDSVTVGVRAQADGTELVLIGTLVAAECTSAESAECAGTDG